MRRLRVLWIPLLTLAVAGAASAEEQERSPVKVERVKPKKPKKPTLRFLKQNVDFLRGQLDWLEQVPRSSGDDALTMDERWLRYREMMASATTSRDSVEAARLAQERTEFLESVADLADLEQRLDAMAALLDDQETRLAWLDADFTGRQETAVIVLLGGLEDPSTTGVRVANEAGDVHHVEITAEHRDVLSRDGVVQLMHDFVEPREQVWEISFVGKSDETTPPFYLTFRPKRDRLSFLELDARDVTREAGLTAELWIHGGAADTDDWRWASR